MSYDITVFRDGVTLYEMNWLRNPFGLCQWAEDNTQPPADGITLHHVCNWWSYSTSNDLDRVLFHRVVHAYGVQIASLRRGFFVFDLPAYRQIIEPRLPYLPVERNPFDIFPTMITGSRYDDRHRLMIPMEHFSHRAFNLGEHVGLSRWQRWFTELECIADLLIENPALKVDITN